MGEDTVKVWNHTDFTELEARCMVDFLAHTTVEDLQNDPYTLYAEKHRVRRTEAKALLGLILYSNCTKFKKGDNGVL